MTWIMHDDRYSVDVNAVDRQHEAFVGTLKEIHSAMTRGQAQDAAAPLLRTLADDISGHLASMEAIMTFTGFPGIEAHRAKHRELARQIRAYAVRVEKGDCEMPPQLLNMIRVSLAENLQQQDSEFAPWLRDSITH